METCFNIFDYSGQIIHSSLNKQLIIIKIFNKMKNLFKTFTGAVLLGVLLTSCNKDDDNENPTKNYFKVDDITYEISSGVLENYGIDYAGQYEGYNLDLNLVSKGIQVSEDDYGEMEVTGSGQIIYFEMFSSNGLSLDNGDYNFDGISPFPVGTFDYGDYAINWDENDEDWIEISSGKVTVNKTGNEYEITINCTDENGANITGYYKGLLEYYNYDTESKSTRAIQKRR
jgi:hypothetical protein